MTEPGAFRTVLTTIGRLSGRQHRVHLKAVMYGGDVYLSRHRPDSDWFQNALKNSQVSIQMDNMEHPGTASLVSNEALVAKISELKYPGEDRAGEKRVVIKVVLH